MQWLQTGDLAGLAAAQTLGDADLWALVAFLWQEAAPPDAYATGQSLYQQNCAACHGEQGRGDGYAAGFSPGQEPDFTDLAAAAGASPALYYAKLARGGMGTGMPNWGAILTEDELWALVSTVAAFAFDNSPQEP
jgi:high-affinity iron transporter